MKIQDDKTKRQGYYPRKNKPVQSDFYASPTKLIYKYYNF